MAGQGYLQDDRPDFPKILEFFTDPRTEDLQARQHALLKRIVQKCQHGFRLRELPVVAELLDIVPKRIEGLIEKDAEESEELERTLCNIIRITAKPNLRQKANEELLAPGLKAAAQILEKLLLLQSSTSVRVAVEATRALTAIATPEDTSAAGKAQKKLNRKLLLEANAVQATCAKVEENANIILAIDDDGTERKVFDARATVDFIDADTSDDEDVTMSRSSSRGGRRRKPRSAKTDALFSDVLSYSTHKRTLEYAQSQVLRSLVHLLRELSTDAQSSFDLVECGGARAAAAGGKQGRARRRRALHHDVRDS